MASVRKDIKEAKEILKEIMIEHLKDIAESMIDSVMKNYRSLPESKKIDAIKNINSPSTAQYKNDLLSGTAIIAASAIERARSEVPAASKVKLAEWDEDRLMLGEFEKLPPKVRKRLKSQIDLLLDTQKKDLDKVIMFQFSSSVGSTDSESLIEYDIYESAQDWIEGKSIDAGAGIISARTINESRQAFFFDDEVLEEIDAFQFKNDVPETPICEDLNGTIFSSDDPGFQRYTPPLHYNCDSYIVPILKGKLKDREITKLQPSSSDLEKYIQFHDECCGRVFLSKI